MRLKVLISALVAVVLAGLVAEPVLGATLGDMAANAAKDFRQIPRLLEILFYIVGAVLVFSGLMLLRRHSTHPQQVTVSSGAFAIVIGVALIFAPVIIDRVGETVGLSDGNQQLTLPKLKN